MTVHVVDKLGYHFALINTDNSIIAVELSASTTATAKAYVLARSREQNTHLSNLIQNIHNNCFDGLRYI